MIKIYRRLWQINWAEQWQYRANLLMYLLYWLVSPVVYLAVWSSIARSQGSVNGLTVHDFTTYFLTLLVVDLLTSDITIHILAYKIQDGTLSAELLKPVHPILTNTLVNNLAFKTLTLMGLLPVWIVLALLFQPDFSSVTMGNLVLAVPALIFGFGISFLFGSRAPREPGRERREEHADDRVLQGERRPARDPIPAREDDVGVRVAGGPRPAAGREGLGEGDVHEDHLPADDVNSQVDVDARHHQARQERQEEELNLLGQVLPPSRGGGRGKGPHDLIGGEVEQGEVVGGLRGPSHLQRKRDHLDSRLLRQGVGGPVLHVRASQDEVDFAPGEDLDEILQVLGGGLDPGLRLHILLHPDPEPRGEVGVVPVIDTVPPLVNQWKTAALTHGWAYGEGGVALRGKTWLSAITTGGSDPAYRREGLNRFSIRELLTPLEQAVHRIRTVPPDGEMVLVARAARHQPG